MAQTTVRETVAGRIAQALETSGLSQRDLANATGISQSTLSRMLSGVRPPKMDELLALAWALGCTISELTGHSLVRDRITCVARATDGANMAGMRRELIHYLELDAYLADQGIPQAV